MSQQEVKKIIGDKEPNKRTNKPTQKTKPNLHLIKKIEELEAENNRLEKTCEMNRESIAVLNDKYCELEELKERRILGIKVRRWLNIKG